jgi:hypothetical protein
MQWDRQSVIAFGGIAVFAAGGALLLADASSVSVPVLGMVGGIAAMALANHERLKLRMEALEQRLAQAEWRSGSIASGNFQIPANHRDSRRPVKPRGRATAGRGGLAHNGYKPIFAVCSSSSVCR